MDCSDSTPTDLWVVSMALEILIHILSQAMLGRIFAQCAEDWRFNKLCKLNSELYKESWIMSKRDRVRVMS